MGKKGKYNKNQQEEQEPRKKKIMITEEHLMDKTHMDFTDFFSMIPEDSLYPPFATGADNVRILRKIVKDLNYLLFQDFKVFWATILYNPSLKNCLNSCLKFLHRGWLNDYYTNDNERRQYYELIKDRADYELTEALLKIILFIHYRILNCEEENSHLTDLYRLHEEILNKFLLDFPRIIELIEIYGKTNTQIVQKIVKTFVKISPNLYTQIKQEYMDIILDHVNMVNILKRVSDREQFGIEFSYKRNNEGQLSPGQQELKVKINYLMRFVSFYDMMGQISEFFPENIGEFFQFSEEIHSMNENLFIEIEHAYRTWNNHEVGPKIYPLMNFILRQIVKYFVGFLQKCEFLFVKRTIKSNTIGAYLKCLDRMLQFYGRRVSLGKKANNKRFMELYREILKQFKLDEFLSQIYVDQIENETFGINIEYLVDFKLAVDEQVIRINGGRRQIQDHQGLGQPGLDEEKTEAGNQDLEMMQAVEEIESMHSKKSEALSVPANEEMNKLEQLVSKRDRSDNYYHNLYSDYRTKYTAEYEDEYDDLVDYEKRPIFQANKSESEDGLDSEEEQLHLVKSQSNAGRNRSHYVGEAKQMNTSKFNNNSKYDRKNKVKYVAVKGQQINPDSKPINSREYDDEQCFQDCKARIRMEEEDAERKVNNSSMNTYAAKKDYGNGNGKNNGNGNGKNNGNKGKAGGSNNNKGKSKYVAKQG